MVNIVSEKSYPPVFIGIDPGKKGGFVTIRGAGNRNKENVDCFSMPETTNDLWNWFRQRQIIFERCSTFCVLEQVSTSPQMGVVSAGTFMYGVGQLVMALVAARIPFEQIRPQVWQKSLGIVGRKKSETDRKWKRRLGEHAKRLFPDLPLWNEKLGVIDAVSDALLIAEYCRRNHYERMK